MGDGDKKNESDDGFADDETYSLQPARDIAKQLSESILPDKEAARKRLKKARAREKIVPARKRGGARQNKKGYIAGAFLDVMNIIVKIRNVTTMLLFLQK